MGKVTSTIRTPSLFSSKPFHQARLLFSGVSDEAALLRKMVNQYGADLALKEVALKIIFDEGVKSRDEYEQAIAIAEWVQENIYYVHETMETFQTPFTTLRLRAGDCDDFTVLICALIQTLGIPNKLALMKINDKWAHIFAVGLLPVDGVRHRVPLDATLDRDRYPVRDVPSPVAIAQKRGQKTSLLLV